MKNDVTLSILKIAETHSRHLQDALDDMKGHYPFSEDFLANLTKADLRTLDTLTTRFAKLQDLLGLKIIDLCLNSLAEPILGQSIIDKVHKLEKLTRIS